MAHLGPNLLPTWPILSPSWAHLRQKSPPNRARNLKKRPQTPQDHPEGRQRAPGQPWGSNFHSFGVDFGLKFSGCSFSLSFYSSWPPCLKFGTVAAWRAQRTGYFSVMFQTCSKKVWRRFPAKYATNLVNNGKNEPPVIQCAARAKPPPCLN